jgi:hypothetical protein
MPSALSEEAMSDLQLHPHDGDKIPSQHFARDLEHPQTPPWWEQHPLRATSPVGDAPQLTIRPAHPAPFSSRHIPTCSCNGEYGVLLKRPSLSASTATETEKEKIRTAITAFMGHLRLLECRIAEYRHCGGTEHDAGLVVKHGRRRGWLPPAGTPYGGWNHVRRGDANGGFRSGNWNFTGITSHLNTANHGESTPNFRKPGKPSWKSWKAPDRMAWHRNLEGGFTAGCRTG